jgi:hypothetical protein
MHGVCEAGDVGTATLLWYDWRDLGFAFVVLPELEGAI